ncbi:MAG: helical backbone metal receptor [Myxococcota bacterium]
MSFGFVDARGFTRSLASSPRRVVSLVPSDTYNLFALGVGDRLVARTEYCVAPAPAVDAIETVGGTKSADVARIVALGPDLVLANQEENRRVDVERLEAAGLTVWLAFPQTVAAGLHHVEALAGVFDVDDRAPIARGWAAHRRHAEVTLEPVPTFVPIWRDPLMTVHGATFISDVVELCGGRNVFSDRRRRYPLAADLGRREPVPKPERDDRYPRVTRDEVRARAPRLVLLPDEPFAFSEADAADFVALLPAGVHVRRCVGMDLMWYGLRAAEGLDAVANLVAAARDPDKS